MTERTAEFILGLIGGIFGILAVPGLLFLGAVSRYFGGPDTILMWAVGGGILSIIGLIGAAFVKSRPKAAGAIMLISGFLGLFLALGLWIGALLLIVAGIVALIRKEKPAQPSPPSISQQVYYCTKCGKPLTFMSQSKRWYCESCKSYAPSETQNP
jgi:ribosomal protein S27AE